MFRFAPRALAALTLLLAASIAASPLSAQTTRKRHENATRKARIARNIQQTYTHRWDLFVGGGYERFRSGDNLQRNNQVTWALNLTRNFTPKWGVVGDLRGSYGNAKVSNDIYTVYNPLITQYTFMVGPQYRFYRGEKYSASVHVLGGAAMGNFDGGSKAISAYHFGMWDTSTAPVVSVGVNLEYNFYTNFAFRLTPTYVGTMFRGVTENADGTRGSSTGSIQNNLGFNMGIVYRWGHQ